MRKIFLLIAFLLFNLNLFSQDILVRTNGDRINCKIISIDSVNVNFSYDRNGTEINTNIRKEQLKDIIYESSSGQHNSDSITMKKVVGGYHFYQGDKRLNISQLVKTMESNELAYNEMKAAQTNNTIASIFGFSGGFLVGWTLGTAVAGGEPNWVLAGVGAGLILISIPITQKFNEQAKTAVDSFNTGINTGSFWKKTELKFAMSGNGIGLILNF